MALQSNNGNVSGKLKAYVGILLSNYQTFKDLTNCRKRKINCGKDKYGWAKLMQKIKTVSAKLDEWQPALFQFRLSNG